MRRLLALTAISLIGLALSTAASATQVLFDITGANTISFTVDQSPTPDFFTSNDHFGLSFYSYTLNGNPEISVADLFYTDGALTVGNFEFDSLDGGYFSGTTENPTFLTGTYRLVGGPHDTASTFYSLSISTVASVPEPATWATMLLGFGAIGFSIRAARRKGKLGSAAV